MKCFTILYHFDIPFPTLYLYVDIVMSDRSHLAYSIHSTFKDGQRTQLPFSSRYNNIRLNHYIHLSILLLTLIQAYISIISQLHITAYI